MAEQSGSDDGANSKCTRLWLQVTATRDNVLRQHFGHVTYFHATLVCAVCMQNGGQSIVEGDTHSSPVPPGGNDGR
jgi:hypothetical protein